MPRKASGAWKGELPALELECMKVLWEGGELTVHGVRDRLQARRPLAYTTVLTLLGRLARRGAVSRRKTGRAHLYRAVYTRSAAREVALARLLEDYFGGSRDLLRQHLAPAGAAPVPEREVAGQTLDPALEPAMAAPAEASTALDPTLL